MVTLLSEIHFWTTQEDVIIKHTDFGSFKLFNKKDLNETVLGQWKKHYCEQRGILWHINNKRPQKLRDKLKELEELLIHNKVVYYTWENNKLRLLLSTGLILSITVNNSTGDLTSIVFDKQLSVKLQVNIICDGILIGNRVICVCNDGHLLGFGGQWKDGWVLEGGPRRRLNYHGDWLAVWGKAGSEHPQPWSPLAKDHQRANLHLYWIGSRDPELLAYKKTDGEPLQVVVSKQNDRVIIVIEQKVTQRGAVSVEISNFELIGNNLKRLSVTSVPLQTQVSCTVLSDQEDRLLICCIDGSLALLNRNRGTTRTVKAAFIPTLAAWHVDGAIVTVLNDKGQLQYYDTALNCIKSQIISEDITPSAVVDLSGYFNMQFSIASVNWGPKNLIFSLEQGPLTIITHFENSLSFKSLIKRYLIKGKVDKAIKLLLSWEFNEDSFFGLQKIVAYLLKRPLTEEIAQHLQNALGSFHNSPMPITPKIRHRYGSQVYYMTRRFFHHLVRAQMFETAFLLAVDLGHHDLFMDLHYIAVTLGQTEMAAAARAQASALLSRCSSEASNCSRSSCSQCSDTESSSSSNDFSLSKNQKESNMKTSYVPPLPINSDNILATDFNHPDPTTYRPLVEQENMPVASTAMDYQRPSYPPKATYVKSPQVPSNFTKVNLSNHSNVVTPPLPFTPPLPNLCNSTLGIPYTHNIPFNNLQNLTQVRNKNFFHSTIDMSTVNHSFSTNGNNSRMFPNAPLYSAFSSSNPNINSIKKSFTALNKVVAPPLPTIPAHQSEFNRFPAAKVIDDFGLPSNSTPESFSSSSTNGKKHQAKVKFSDTVTAFIVPEIKRPQRQQPPAHVMDPQKELADSLPLCHPNEDYLKDFTPIRKEENSEEDTDGSQPPKIKVVHFGVV